MSPPSYDELLSRAPYIELMMSQDNLASRIVHLWWIDLDGLARSGRHIADNLSPDERRRAERSSGGVTGSRFALGRGCLREIVGAYCEVHPSLVKFEYGPCGKPSLAGVSGADRLTFSTSYADRLMVIAVAIGEELGIDIEPLKRHRNIAPIADAVFSQDEIDLLGVMPQRKRETAMVRGWTAKEAVLKADGRGLVTNLTTIEVLNDPGKSTGCSALRPAWRVLDVSVPVSGHVASLAVPARLDAPGQELCKEPQSWNWR
jgi:4'-phosphopantetheinyl transferase